MSKKTDKQGYVLFSAIPFSVRFLLLLVLVLGGLYWQLASRDLFPGLLLIIAASLLAYRRGIDLKITARSRKVEWESVPVEKWQQIRALRKETNRWKSSFSNLASGKGIIALGTFLIIVIVMAIILSETDVQFMILLLINLVILAIPTFLSGIIGGFDQPELTVKLKALLRLHNDLIREHRDLELKPMLGLAQGKQGDKKGKVPVDAKMMIKFPDQPGEFYGVQVNCSLNKVSGANYPYVYAVVLTSPQFDIDQRNPPRPRGKKLVYEPSSSAEAVVLVVRQKTTKTSGYHTEPKHQLHIVNSAIDLARRILSGERKG
jgi:hypothetical protein